MASYTVPRRCEIDRSNFSSGCFYLQLTVELLRRSKNYPNQRLRNLVARYKQHKMLHDCMREITEQLHADESSSRRTAGRRESVAQQFRNSLLNQ